MDANENLRKFFHPFVDDEFFRKLNQEIMDYAKAELLNVAVETFSEKSDEHNIDLGRRNNT